jgi:hypothetical protein
MKKFRYLNKEHKKHGNKKTIRMVFICGGKGHKSITNYRNGKKIRTVKKPLTIIEIVTIQRGKFIPNLFSDCKGPNCANKTRKK